MDNRDFDRLTRDLPALRDHGRPGVEFVPFDPGLAGSICGSAYAIPFVSATECLVTRRANGRWVLPGGTLDPGETWLQAAHRELMEETGAALDAIAPIGMYRCVSTADRPRLPHFPHPVHVRVVCCADARRVRPPHDPDGHSKITEVRAVRYDQTAALFAPEDRDFAALYHLAFSYRQQLKNDV